MIFNYLITAFRNAKRQWGYYTINFVGLTIGMTCCALVALYVKHERSYDNFHRNPETIHRLTGQHSYAETWFTSIATAYSDVLIDGKLPGVSNIVRIGGGPPKTVRFDGKKFSGDEVVRIETSSPFFDLFNLDMTVGDPSQAFKELHSAILTESTAAKYFDSENPIGRIIKYDTLLLNVTGVLADLPSNTHFSFDLLITENSFIRDWAKSSRVYFRVEDEVDINRLGEELQAQQLGLSHYDSISRFKIEPIQDIHLDSHVEFDFKSHGDSKTLFIFTVIAGFILLISCSNYVNLSAAIYSTRNIEIGMRKVLGGSKSSLRQQFLFESILISLATIPLVIFLIQAILPYYNNFLGITLENWFLNEPPYMLILLTISLATGLLAGAYPALTLPTTNVIKLLRKKGSTSVMGLRLRRSLIALQFTLLMILGLGAFVVNQQLQFVNNMDIGIQKDGLVKIPRAYYLNGVENIQSFNRELLSDPSVTEVSQGNVPGDSDYPSDYQPEGGELHKDALYTVTDFNYFDLLGIEGLTGPYFEESRQDHPDLSLVVNEAFVKNLGWEINEAIGKRIITNPGDSILRYRTIRGVIKDFNFFSLHQEPTPYLIYVRKNRPAIWENVLIKIDMNNATQALSWIEETWNKFQPESPYMMKFVDDDLQKAYENDQKTATLSTVLSITAIALAVLGLVGLSAYVTELQTKQIGIRKVLGASTPSLIYTLNKEYLWLILVSNIIAGLVGFYFINQWLDGFAYRITLNPLLFPLAGLMVLTITFLTVSFQSVKAARANPVEALRSE